MKKMTEEEAQRLDEYMTNNEITLGPNGSGWFSKRESNPWGYSNMTVKYLVEKSRELQKSPAQIIDELVSKEIAAVAAV